MSNTGLGIASGAINLTQALINFVPSSGSLIDISRETYNWIVRERIDEASFESCRKLALGLAYPNDAGMDIRRQIKEADQKIVDKIKQLPVQMVVSGSLGRLLGKDVDTCYMVSTVAALTRFHDPEFATDALCSIILDKGGHEKEVSLTYSVQRSPIKAVISKIVESIYLNVVNAGHDLGELPDELQDLHQHLLDDRTFAGIVMGIQRTESDVVIRSERFLADLTLWLLLHFQGTIGVSVKGQILFERILGPSSRVVRIMVKERCPDNADSCLKNDAPVEAFVSVGDKLLPFLRGTDDNDFHPCSYTRQSFYEVENLTSSPRSAKSTYLNRAECNSIADAAKVIMGWLLDIRIQPAPDLLGLTFRALLESNGGSDGDTLTLGHLLQNHPGLLSLNTGFSTVPGPVLRRPDDELSDEYSDSEGFEVNPPPTPGSIIEWFPAVQSLLEQIQPRCSCSACKTKAKLDNCKRGCLREAAATRLFILLAHGISEAFGAQDVSGRSNPEDQVTGVTTLLAEILQQQLIRWDTWFELVGCTAAGISWDAFDYQGDDGSSSFAAIQYGSFVAVAPWLDLTKMAQVKGCFGIVVVEGNIQGVPDDAGLVRCEMDQFDETYQELSEVLDNETSMEEPSRMGMDDEAEGSMDSQVALQLDTLKTEVFTAIFRSDRFMYRLMTTVRAGRNIRIVDPSQAIMGLARSVITQCDHEPASPLAGNFDIEVDDFDRILSKWASPEEPLNTVQMTKLIDEPLKLNTLLTIARKGSIIRVSNKCCLFCAIDGLRNFRDNGPRRIINSSVSPSRQIKKRRLG